MAAGTSRGHTSLGPQNQDRVAMRALGPRQAACQVSKQGPLCTVPSPAAAPPSQAPWLSPPPNCKVTDSSGLRSQVWASGLCPRPPSPAQPWGQAAPLPLSPPGPVCAAVCRGKGLGPRVVPGPAASTPRPTERLPPGHPADTVSHVQSGSDPLLHPALPGLHWVSAAARGACHSSLGATRGPAACRGGDGGPGGAEDWRQLQGQRRAGGDPLA